MAEEPSVTFFTAKSTFPAFNGWKVSILLEELQIPYKVTALDLDKAEHKTPEFLKINPNGRIPALIDHTNSNYSVFESNAILLYLAERFNKFLPTELDQKYEVIQWLFFQASGVGPMQGQAHAFVRYAPTKIDYAINRYQNETRRLYEVLDGRLKGREYIAGEFSVADIACFPWVSYHDWAGVDIDGLDNLHAWIERIGNREKVQRGMNIPSGKPIKELLENAEEIQKVVAATSLDKIEKKTK